MIHSRILSICLICLAVAACNTQEQVTPVNKTTDRMMVPEKVDTEKAVSEKTADKKRHVMNTRPALNLSINNMHIDQHVEDDNYLSTGKEPSANTDALFKTPAKNQMEPRVNLSGKLFTDEDKVKNREYLDSVDGVQINIKGTFN